MGVNRPAKARALGAALREERLKAGYESLRGFAEQRLGVAPSTLSRWESGQRSPGPTDVARMLTLLSVGGERYEELLALATDTESPNWMATTLLQQKQHLAAVLRFEAEATAITSVAPLIVPAGLQTTAYVRAIMTSGSVPDDDVDTRIAVRLGRRERLSEVRLTALVGEAALRMEIGGVRTMIDQLRHLMSMSGQERVDLQVVPFAAGWNPSLSGPWTLFEFADAEPVVHLENRRSGLMLHEPEDVSAYREAVKLSKEAAMSPTESVRLIAKVINEFEEREANVPAGAMEKG